jgi:dimethylamine/trimethylamine dehydrogenase
MLAELPDLWDVNLSSWENDSQTSRFSEEGFQEQYTAFVKSMTSKPVVGVGRFTSPDAMISQINRGILDMIGGARPSIADPFLPQKIEQGRSDEIRECIGCNMCVSGHLTFTPMRCTQNPSVGEEWRRNWHPETIPAKGSDDNILVVGAGPSGLEAARALGQRGYEVTLAEAKTEAGGRVSEESRLPGLAAWIRVRDWRIGRIQQMENVNVYFDNKLEADEIIALDYQHIIVATGSHWRADGVGISNWKPIPGTELDHVFTPEVVFADRHFNDPVVVFDDDNFYMGALIAEKLKKQGHRVTLVTNATEVSSWTQNTLEQHRIQTHILELGIDVVTTHNLARINPGTITTSCIYSGKENTLDANSVVLVTSRLPNEELYLDLAKDPAIIEDVGIKSVTAIGDCLCPSTIASAVYEGHRVAREFDAAPENPDMPFRREEISLENFEYQEVSR